MTTREIQGTVRAVSPFNHLFSNDGANMPFCGKPKETACSVFETGVIFTH